MAVLSTTTLTLMKDKHFKHTEKTLSIIICLCSLRRVGVLLCGALESEVLCKGHLIQCSLHLLQRILQRIKLLPQRTIAQVKLQTYHSR